MKVDLRINLRFWLTICMASIFGCNVGDWLADTAGLGHLSGLPYLAVAFAALIAAARAAPSFAPPLFWAVVIVVRAAATNIGDSLHDFGVNFDVSLPVTSLILASLALLAWSPGAQPSPSKPIYWMTMFTAGALGTLGGDFLSFGAHLGNFNAMVVSALPIVALVALRKWPLLAGSLFYWLTIAFIRTSGTAGGDWLAHLIGLSPATVLTGLIFAGLVFTFYPKDPTGASKTA